MAPSNSGKYFYQYFIYTYQLLKLNSSLLWETSQWSIFRQNILFLAQRQNIDREQCGVVQIYLFVKPTKIAQIINTQL